MALSRLSEVAANWVAEQVEHHPWRVAGVIYGAFAVVMLLVAVVAQ